MAEGYEPQPTEGVLAIQTNITTANGLTVVTLRSGKICFLRYYGTLTISVPNSFTTVVPNIPVPYYTTVEYETMTTNGLRYTVNTSNTGNNSIDLKFYSRESRAIPANTWLTGAFTFIC